MTTYTAKKAIRIKGPKDKIVTILPGQSVELTGDDEKQALRKGAVWTDEKERAAATRAAEAEAAKTAHEVDPALSGGPATGGSTDDSGATGATGAAEVVQRGATGATGKKPAAKDYI